MILTAGNYPVNMLDEDFFGMGSFFPDEDPDLVSLTTTQIRVRDRITGATITLSGTFTIQGGLITAGTVTGMTWRAGNNDLLIDFSSFSLPIEQALEGALTDLFTNNNTVTGSSSDDILLGLDGNDLIRGGDGNDLLLAYSGTDTLEGGTGADILSGIDEPEWQQNLYLVAETLLSSDGRYVVFRSEANAFGGSGELGEQGFFRGDLETAEIERVLGPFDPADIFETPVISGDGRFLAMVGPATFAVEESSGYPQLLLLDMETGEISLLSRTPGGELAGYLPEGLAISGDGGVVAFGYLDSDLVEDDTNDRRDIFVWREESGTIERASVAEDGSQADGSSWFPSLSADGTLLAFASAATNLTVDGTPEPAAYIKNLETDAVERIATLANPSTFAFDIGPSPLMLSANGRFLTFISADSTLVEGDFNGVADVFVHDLQSGETVRASEDPFGFGGQYYSYQPAISGDGRYVAFLTESTWDGDLYDANFRPDVFVKDLLTGSLHRIPVPGSDNVGTTPPSFPQLSFDGDTLVFHYASNGTVLAMLDNSGLHTLRGQSGDDLYVLLRLDTAEEFANGGYDVLAGIFSGTYTLPQNIEAFAHAVEGNLSLLGNDLDNRFLGTAGDESWDGSAGVDILSLQTLYDEISLTREEDHWVVSGPMIGTDQLFSVERLEMEDIGLALDTDGNAGDVFALLYAGLGETPDPGLITPWLIERDAGYSTTEIAGHMLEFYGQGYPGGIPNELLVSTLWLNLVGSEIPQDELDGLTLLLTSGQMTQADLFATAANHAYTQDAIEPLIESGIFYEPVPFEWNTSAWDNLL